VKSILRALRKWHRLRQCPNESHCQLQPCSCQVRASLALLEGIPLTSQGMPSRLPVLQSVSLPVPVPCQTTRVNALSGLPTRTTPSLAIVRHGPLCRRSRAGTSSAETTIMFTGFPAILRATRSHAPSASIQSLSSAGMSLARMASTSRSLVAIVSERAKDPNTMRLSGGGEIACASSFRRPITDSRSRESAITTRAASFSRSRHTSADDPASRRAASPKLTSSAMTTDACWGLTPARRATVRIVISVSVRASAPRTRPWTPGIRVSTG